MSRLRDLDDRVLSHPSSAAREAWGRKHGWSLFVLLGVALLAVCAWALVVDRPAIAGMNVGFGIALVAIGVSLFRRRR